MEYVDLLPDSTRERQLWRTRVLKWGFVAFGFVLLVIGYSFVVGRQVAAVKQELVPLEREVADREELKQDLERLEQDLQRTVEKQGTLKEVVDQRDWAHAFADIAEAALDNAWLERTQFTKVKIRQKSAKSDEADEDEQEEEQDIVKVKLTARGYADSNFDLANFMAKLEKTERFDDVELNFSELTKVDRGDRLILFEIEGTLL
jgi:Tfp pilus assembly protein PilN